jgi:hypothetical protein
VQLEHRGAEEVVLLGDRGDLVEREVLEGLAELLADLRSTALVLEPAPRMVKQSERYGLRKRCADPDLALARVDVRRAEAWVCEDVGAVEELGVLEREICQVGPKDASWPMHSCGDTAIKG